MNNENTNTGTPAVNTTPGTTNTNNLNRRLERRPFNRRPNRGPNTGPNSATRTPSQSTTTPHTHRAPGASPVGKTGFGAKKSGRNNKRRGGNNNNRRGMTSPALTHRMTLTDEKNPTLPTITDEDTVRIITVSGVEEIGRNMNIIETKDDIFIIDAGFNNGVCGISAYRIITSDNREYFGIGIKDSLNFYTAPFTISLTNTSLYRLHFSNTNCEFFSTDTDTQVSGALTVSKLDRTNRIISGTFNATLSKTGCFDWLKFHVETTISNSNSIATTWFK